MENLFNFVKSLKGWQKIVAFVAACVLAACALFAQSCSAQKTLRITGTVENATFDYNSDGKVDIR